MLESVRARFFEPFFTTKDVGKGSGLGLSQAYGFAQQSGGSIAIESELGRGTVVTFELPTTDESALPDPSRSEPSGAAVGRRSILLVEDEPALATVAEQMLGDMGHHVHLASHAEGALRILEAGEPIDLVFSDIVMPGGMNGFELARTIRSRHPKLPILLTTGYSDAAASAGAAGFPIVAKPYREDEIARSIEHLLAEPLRKVV